MALTNRDYKLTTHITSPQDSNQENVYWFQADTASTAFALVNVFLTETVPFIMDTVTSSANMFRIDCVNMVDLDDFITLDTDVDGTRGASAMPVFNVLSFTYNPSTRAVNHGKKSIGPLSEGDVTNGVITVTFAPFVTDLATQLATTLNGVFADFVPGIMKTTKEVCAECKSGFRYVPTTFYPVSTVTYNRVSHLTSRPSA